MAITDFQSLADPQQYLTAATETKRRFVQVEELNSDIDLDLRCLVVLAVEEVVVSGGNKSAALVVACISGGAKVEEMRMEKAYEGMRVFMRLAVDRDEISMVER